MVYRRLLGVNIQFIKDFINKNGGRNAFFGKSMIQIYKEFIYTIKNQENMNESLCEIEIKSHNNIDNIGISNWLINYSLHYYFLEVIDSIENYFNYIHNNDVDMINKEILWMDLFSCPIHDEDTIHGVIPSYVAGW